MSNLQSGLKRRGSPSDTLCAMHRHRIDTLFAAPPLPGDVGERARMACAVLERAGFHAVVALHVRDSERSPIPCGSGGAADGIADVARGVATRFARDAQPLLVLDVPTSHGRGGTLRVAAVSLGRVVGGQAVLVMADPRLTQREAQALAAWTTHPSSPVQLAPCGALARDLAAEFDADVITLSIFARSGLTQQMFVRSGGLVRSWRSPADTVWGEAARHGSAYALGDLHLHPGMELYAAMGMRQAAIVGLGSPDGLGIGALGVSSAGHLGQDIPHVLLERAPAIGRDVMSMLADDPTPLARPETDDAMQSVDVRAFAISVGCRRLALYQRDGQTLRLIAACAEDGSRLLAPPDPREPELVRQAALSGQAAETGDAVAIAVGEKTVLYAQDPHARPGEQLRRALGELRQPPDSQGGRSAAA